MSPEQFVVPYPADATLPPDEHLTPYCDGSRQLWTVPAGTAIYVGSAERLDRWGLVLGDEIERTDCG